MQVVKHDLTTELECALRDLRVVDPAYPHQFPTFMARPKAIVMCLENIRVNQAIVVHDSLHALFLTRQLFDEMKH